jgi:large subunit ribosomal protein L15
MITINTLPKITKEQKKRIGRGHGSGRVKTGGRGTKGQKSRGKVSIQRGLAGSSFIKRLPLYRGKYKNKSIAKKTIAVNLKYLNEFPKDTVIDKEMLFKNKIISKDALSSCKIKILGDGEIKTALIVKLPCSKNAIKKIEKAGGKIEV